MKFRHQALAAALVFGALQTPLALAQKPAAEPAAKAPVMPAAKPQVKVEAAKVIGATAAAGKGGTASIESTTFEAGDVHKGDVINHDFVVKNTGKEDLLILDVKPACGCTTPGFDKIVPPGGSGKITLKVDTANFKGPIQKTANVTTNDPAQASIRLAVNANVTTYVDVLPRDSVFFRQFLGEEKREELTIHSNEKGDFKIKDVQVTNAPVKYELTPVADKPGDYKLALWLDKTAPVGNFNGTAKLLTSSPKEPEVKIGLNGSILGHLSVNPSSLFYRVDSTTKQVVPKTAAGVELRERGETEAPVLSKLGKDARLSVLEEVGGWMHVGTEAGTEGWVPSKTVQPLPVDAAGQAKVVNVSHREAKPFKVVSSSVEGTGMPATALKIDTAAAGEGAGYQVTVTYAGGLKAGSFNATVVLKTDTKEEPEIRIPVYIVIT